MPRILLVKTSSLGDVVHNLPVATDIRFAAPSAEIHWVVEQPFAAIPALHPAVTRVIPVAIRRWRARFLDGAVRNEIGAFVSELKRDFYDAVIDTQGLLKSALVAWAARGVRHGLDFASSREPLAFFYDRTYSIPWTLHAVERNRALAARALNHAAASAADYGITAPRASFAWLPDGAYAVLVHSASARKKLWPEARWVELATRLEERGMRSVLPWGNADERLRAETIARAVQGTVVAPQLPLAQVATLLAGARAVIGVDTGLSHLAVALKVPAVGLYCVTDPAATGLYGSASAINLGGRDAPPQVADVLTALKKSGV